MEDGVAAKAADQDSQGEEEDEWCSGRRKAKGVKGPRAVTPEERTPGGRILYSEARRVKFDGTRIVSCKLTNVKKVMNHLSSNKDIGKPKGARSRR